MSVRQRTAHMLYMHVIVVLVGTMRDIEEQLVTHPEEADPGHRRATPDHHDSDPKPAFWKT